MTLQEKMQLAFYHVRRHSILFIFKKANLDHKI